MRATILALSLIPAAAFARTEERQVPEFDAIHVASGIHLTVDIGPQKPVRIEASDEALRLLETVVEDGALEIRFKEHTWFRGDHGDVNVTVQTPQLHRLGASGGSVVRATFTRDRTNSVAASGGSELHLRGIDASRLKLQASGGSIIEIEGSADELDMQISGGTIVRGKNLEVKDVEVEGSGGSRATLRASGRITGALSGGSEVHVRGGARARVSASGGSSVEVDD